MENLIREICSVIPIVCPKCETRVPDYRIDLKDMREGIWYLWILCGGCDKAYTLVVDSILPPIKRAIKQVCSDRNLSEELKLRDSGEIPSFYEKELPWVLSEWWSNGPKEDPFPPRTAV